MIIKVTINFLWKNKYFFYAVSSLNLFLLSEQDMASASGENRKSGIVRLSAIRDIMDRGLHALLDVAPNAVDKLNYAQFYPIVLLARADSKQTIKDCRAGLPK